MPGMGGGSEPPKAAAAKADIPFIRCQVCEAAVKQALTIVKGMKEKAGAKKLLEADIIDSLEKLCDPETDEGEWINRMDLQEEGDKLKLVDMGQVGECGTECRTIARACEQLTEDLDLSDLSEMLFKGATKRAGLNQWACRDSTSACTKKPPPLPAGRAAGPGFKPMDADAVQRQKLMRSMKAAGMRGTMYDRESMMSQLGNSGEEDEDAEDSSATLGNTAGSTGLPDVGDPMAADEL